MLCGAVGLFGQAIIDGVVPGEFTLVCSFPQNQEWLLAMDPNMKSSREGVKMSSEGHNDECRGS